MKEKKPLPELKFPPDHSLAEAHAAAEREDSFARAFRTAVDRGLKRYPVKLSYTTRGIDDKPDDREDLIKKLCRKLNDQEGDICLLVAEHLQQYLLEHDGRIDAWPDPASQVGTEFPLVEAKAFFDYFGADYAPKNQFWLARKSKELVYHNGCRYRTIVTDLRDRAAAERDIRKDQKARGPHRFRLFCALLGALLCAYVSLSLAAALFIPSLSAHMTAWREAISQWGATSLVKGLVDLFHRILTVPAALLALLRRDFDGGGIVWIPGLFMLAIAIGGVVWCIRKMGEERDALGSLRCYIRASQKQMRRDPAEIEAEKEQLNREAAEFKAFTESWHRAWFDWACRHKGGAA